MKLCLGTVQFGVKYGIAAKSYPSIAQSLKIMELAFENGINCLDTATAYGKAEEIAGMFIKNLNKRNKINVVSKLPPLILEGESKKRYAQIIRENVSKSLEKLNLDYLDYYLLHNSKEVFNPYILDALYCLVEEKKVCSVGVSIYTPQEAEAVKKDSRLTSIQVPYNIMDRRLDQTGFFINIENKTVFCRSILLQGLLTMDAKDMPRKMIFAEKELVLYDNFCAKWSLTRKEMAIGYIRQKAGIDYALIGVDNEEQLKEQLKLFHTKLPLEIVKEADEIFQCINERVLNPALW